MNLASKKASLLILGVTSILLSRAMFAFFDDPEGPNLLVVFVTAAIVYLPALAVYLRSSSVTSIKRLLLAIFVQVLTVAGLYLLLNVV